jgi:SUMO ligase MMS21 Smc5/6 complex component
LIENVKNGVNSADADLVIEASDENRINKCPITAKEIIEEFKNPKCGHAYEKSAIIQYCKGKSKK